MSAILHAGIDNILWLQEFQTPGSYALWEIFTNFGGTYYLYMVPALLWVVDYRLGLRVVVVLTATLIVNSILKELFAQPRPFEFDPRVVSDGEIGYGLPSGHAQLAVLFWGVLADWVDRKPFWIFALAMMFLMGMSRMILGVHFPTDVFAGWLLGGVMLWAYRRYRAGFEARLAELDSPRLSLEILMAAGASFVLVWMAGTELAPLGAGAAGMILGAGFGAAVGTRLLSFQGHGPWWQRILRYCLGLVVLLFFLATISRAGIPEGGLGALVLAGELALIGGWLTLGGPWLFEMLSLSRQSEAV